MSKILYASIVGSIMYVIICTRLDIVYSLRVMSRYQSNADENHWKVVKTILKYLKNTKDQWLIYRDFDLKLMRYTDFSFQSDHDDSKSMSRYIFILNGGAIYWKYFKQHTVADSACEVESSRHSMLPKKLFACGSSSTSLEWHPPLMILFYCIVIALVP